MVLCVPSGRAVEGFGGMILVRMAILDDAESGGRARSASSDCIRLRKRP
jgi:hypothetical protein